MLLAPLSSVDDTRCRVLSVLSSCWGLCEGNAERRAKEQKAALRAGRDLAAANRKKLAPASRRALAERSPLGAHPLRSALWSGWALHFALLSCAVHAQAGETAAAAESLREAREAAAESPDAGAAEARPSPSSCLLCA